jgi:phosphate transport system substrate-binding protein
MKKFISKFTVLAAALALTATSVRAGNITVKGSDTLVILAQKWAEVYMGGHPEVKIQVNGGGSGVGFAALQNQQVDIADASRKIKPNEVSACVKAFGKRPTEYKVALDGLSVYVNESNPVKELTLAQLKDIFTGKVKNWNEVGGSDAPITVYSRENSSGTYEFFKEHVLKGEDFTATAQTQQGTAILLQSIARDKDGIGYGGAAYGGGARALGVKKDEASKAIEPTEETVVNGTYPIWRYLYNYVNPALDKDEIHAYIEWIRSADGQKIVKEVGYYPLPADLMAK